MTITLLGHVEGIDEPAAKMRFFRGDENAKDILCLKRITNHKALIKEIKRDA